MRAALHVGMHVKALATPTSNLRRPYAIATTQPEYMTILMRHPMRLLVAIPIITKLQLGHLTPLFLVEYNCYASQCRFGSRGWL